MFTTVMTGFEQTAFDRGTAQLVNGEVTVTCAPDFQSIADPESMTVVLTPLSADSKGLAVIEKSNGGFKVKELYGGTGNYKFDWEVKCRIQGSSAPGINPESDPRLMSAKKLIQEMGVQRK